MINDKITPVNTTMTSSDDGDRPRLRRSWPGGGGGGRSLGSGRLGGGETGARDLHQIGKVTHGLGQFTTVIKTNHRLKVAR